MGRIPSQRRHDRFGSAELRRAFERPDRVPGAQTEREVDVGRRRDALTERPVRLIDDR